MKVQLKGVEDHLSGSPRLLVIHNYVEVAGCVDDDDEGLGGCCTLAITVTGSPVAVCVGCTTGMETV